MLVSRPLLPLALALAGCTCASEPAPPAPAPEPASAGALTADPPAGEGAVAIHLTSAGPEVLASWVEPGSADAPRIRFARFDVERSAWSEASTVTEGADLLASSVELPAAVRSAGGTFLLTFVRRGGADEASSVHLATSPDGQTWRLRGPIHDDDTDTEHGHVSLLPEGGGARAVWLDGRATIAAGPMAVRTALLDPDGGRTDEAVLDERVCDCCQTAAAAAADGPIVVYRDRDEAERRDLSIVRRRDGAWGAPSAVASDGWTIRGCPVNGPQVAADVRRVVAAWYTEGGGAPQLRVAFSGDAGARFDAPLVLDAAQPLGRVDVEWMADGSALVAWLERRGDAARVLVRRVAPDRRVGAPVEIAPLGGPAAFGAPRLARLGADAMVAWSDSGPPRRVRAVVLRVGELPPPTGAPLAAAVPPEPDAIGAQLPPVVLDALSGEARSLGSFRGRPLVLSFFAGWCAPCREEIPVLAALARRYPDELAVVGISIDESPPEAVARFARAHGITYPVLLDPAGAALGGALGVPPIPATFLLDEAGRVVFVHRGGGATLEPSLAAAVERSIAGEHHGHDHAH